MKTFGRCVIFVILNLIRLTVVLYVFLLLLQSYILAQMNCYVLTLVLIIVTLQVALSCIYSGVILKKKNQKKNEKVFKNIENNCKNIVERKHKKVS